MYYRGAAAAIVVYDITKKVLYCIITYHYLITITPEYKEIRSYSMSFIFFVF